MARVQLPGGILWNILGPQGPEPYTSYRYWFPDPALIDTDPDFITHQARAQNSNKFEWVDEPGMCRFVACEVP